MTKSPELKEILSTISSNSKYANQKSVEIDKSLSLYIDEEIRLLHKYANEMHSIGSNYEKHDAACSIFCHVRNLINELEIILEDATEAKVRYQQAWMLENFITHINEEDLD